MNENEALEILAKHYYCPYDATLISHDILTLYDERYGEEKQRALYFECENCSAKWCVVFDIDE